jgi:hypothetical protein
LPFPRGWIFSDVDGDEENAVLESPSFEGFDGNALGLAPARKLRKRYEMKFEPGNAGRIS